MNPSFASPPPATTVRQWLRRVWDEPDSRSVLIGLIGVLLVHLLLWLVAPRVLRFDHVASARPPAAPQQFNIELAPDAFSKPVPAIPPPPPPPPAPSRFVIANPDAPDNPPDKTENFGQQNQQVAQEVPRPNENNDMPKLDGEKKLSGDAVVSRMGSPETVPAEAVPATRGTDQEQVQEQRAAPQARDILSGTQKDEGKNENSYGENIVKLPATKPIAEQKVEGTDAPSTEPTTSPTGMHAVNINPKAPQPRIRLERRSVGILAKTETGTSRIGVTAANIKWSEYGEYHGRLVEAVQFQWENILIQSKIFPPDGSSVTVVFRLTDEGTIGEIIEVKGDAGALAERSCVSAITSRAPYGAWPHQMRAALGKDVKLTFVFHF